MKNFGIQSSPVVSFFDVVIVGGSFAGLSAALALGRASRRVLIIDEGSPCNRNTPYSHNFLTRDGVAPQKILDIANEEVAKYSTIQILKEKVVSVNKKKSSFELYTLKNIFRSKKVLLATGIMDIFPNIAGFNECWGISILHCPYCHGYEFKDRVTGVIPDLKKGLDFVKLISVWTNKLTLFTNGIGVLTSEEMSFLLHNGIKIVDNSIHEFHHHNGTLTSIRFTNNTYENIDVVYFPLPFSQNTDIHAQLGCELTREGLLKVDLEFETTVPGVFAAGDNASKLRTVSNAVAMGNNAGMAMNRRLISE